MRGCVNETQCTPQTTHRHNQTCYQSTLSGQRDDDHQPTDLHFTLNTAFLPCDEFLIADIHLDTAPHLVFATPFQMTLLNKARRWFIDGTFKIVEAPFPNQNGQLFSINAFIQKDGKKKQFPVVFALMSRRTRADYVRALRAIETKLDQPEISNFVLDFEMGIWQAIREVFPGREVEGCCFQAILRKVGNVGLQTAYNDGGPVHDYVRQILALPFLPARQIRCIQCFGRADRASNKAARVGGLCREPVD